MRKKDMVTIPKYRDLNFKADPNTTEKVVFFSKDSVDMAVKESRIPAEIADRLKAVLDRKGEEAAVMEWQGMKEWKERQAARGLFAAGPGPDPFWHGSH